MSFIEQVKARAAKKNCLIVLPESYDERVTEAAVKIAQEGIARILLLSDNGRKMPNQEKIEESNIEVLDYKNSADFPVFVEALCELRKKKGMTREKA